MIESLYGDLLARPFPELGGSVGDFGLCDALLVGLASRAVQGERFPPHQIPWPDEEAAQLVERLRNAPELTAEEREFLSYHELMDEIALAITDEDAPEVSTRSSGPARRRWRPGRLLGALAIVGVLLIAGARCWVLDQDLDLALRPGEPVEFEHRSGDGGAEDQVVSSAVSEGSALHEAVRGWATAEGGGWTRQLPVSRVPKVTLRTPRYTLYLGSPGEVFLGMRGRAYAKRTESHAHLRGLVEAAAASQRARRAAEG